MSKNVRQRSRRSKKEHGWYSVRVLLKATGRDQPKRIPLFEDRLIPVRADSHKAAQKKAAELTRESEVAYKNSFGNVVLWKVANVYESVELFDQELVDGTQVYWRFIYARDPVKRLRREGTMNGITR